MGIFDNMKKMIMQEGYEENELLEEMEEVQPTSATPASTFQPTAGRPSYVSRSVGLKVMVMSPTSFEESEAIASYLGDMCPVVLNFENTEGHVANRIVDFISGSIYSLNGSLTKVSKDIFIVAPSSVHIEEAKSTEPIVEMPEGLAWKDNEVR